MIGRNLSVVDTLGMMRRESSFLTILLVGIVLRMSEYAGSRKECRRLTKGLRFCIHEEVAQLSTLALMPRIHKNSQCARHETRRLPSASESGAVR